MKPLVLVALTLFSALTFAAPSESPLPTGTMTGSLAGVATAQNGKQEVLDWPLTVTITNNESRTTLAMKSGAWTVAGYADGEILFRKDGEQYAAQVFDTDGAKIGDGDCTPSSCDFQIMTHDARIHRRIVWAGGTLVIHDRVTRLDGTVIELLGTVYRPEK